METTMTTAPKTNQLAFELIIFLIILAPVAYALIIWDQLPEKIPTHWNINGEVDGWMSKPWGPLLMPIVSAGLYFLFRALPHIDPRKEHYEKFRVPFLIIRVMLHVFMSLIGVVILIAAQGYDVPMDKVIHYSVLLVFIILGNYFTTLKSNFFIGIRTPWTLSSENVWKLTHRFAGRLWVFGSLAYLIISLIFPLPLWTFFVFVTIIAGSPIVYSYMLYKKEKQEKK